MQKPRVSRTGASQMTAPGPGPSFLDAPHPRRWPEPLTQYAVTSVTDRGFYAWCFSSRAERAGRLTPLTRFAGPGRSFEPPAGVL